MCHLHGGWEQDEKLHDLVYVQLSVFVFVCQLKELFGDVPRGHDGLEVFHCECLPLMTADEVGDWWEEVQEQVEKVLRQMVEPVPLRVE